MNPTLMARLKDLRRQMTVIYTPSTDLGQEKGLEYYLNLQDAGFKSGQYPRDAVQLLQRLLPHEHHMEEMFKEYEAEMAAGGRKICPQCGERRLIDQTVCTYGRPGVEGSDYSALYECENCDYKDLAG